MRRHPRSRLRGAAVVLAMLMAALAAAVAAAVFADQQRWGRNAEHRRDQVQAQALAVAGIQWGRQILYDDARRSPIDHLGEAWAVALPPIPLENGEVSGSIVDAQARLNVNALGITSAVADLQRARIARLFAQRGGPSAAIDAIADWIDRDSIAREGGAEDAYYAARPRGGLAANAPIPRTAELFEVKGVTPASLAAVAPFLTALPPDTPVNVNTAPPEVLAAMVEKLTGDGLAQLVASRAQRPFSTVAEFRSRLPSPASIAVDDSLSVKSDYFYVTIQARQGSTAARARALLHRRSGQWPEVVWQIVE